MDGPKAAEQLLPWQTPAQQMTIRNENDWKKEMMHAYGHFIPTPMFVVGRLLNLMLGVRRKPAFAVRLVLKFRLVWLLSSIVEWCTNTTTSSRHPRQFPENSRDRALDDHVHIVHVARSIPQAIL